MESIRRNDSSIDLVRSGGIRDLQRFGWEVDDQWNVVVFDGEIDLELY